MYASYRLPIEIEERLTALAKKTDRTKTFYAKEAVLSYIEDLEDTYLAVQRLKKPGRPLSMKEFKSKLNVED